MELALKRLDGVDKAAISIERQQFVVLYKPNSVFQPAQLRQAVSEASVTVVKFHLQARGRAVKQGDTLMFIAGKDKYALTADSAKLPIGKEVVASGDIVNDRKAPFQFKVIDFKPTGK